MPFAGYYGLSYPAWLDKLEGIPLMGQKMIGFDDGIGKRLVSGKRTLYSATGRHVIVQGEQGSNGIVS
jgi:hypothetical protein